MKILRSCSLLLMVTIAFAALPQERRSACGPESEPRASSSIDADVLMPQTVPDPAPSAVPHPIPPPPTDHAIVLADADRMDLIRALQAAVPRRGMATIILPTKTLLAAYVSLHLAINAPHRE